MRQMQTAASGACRALWLTLIAAIAAVTGVTLLLDA